MLLYITVFILLITTNIACQWHYMLLLTLYHVMLFDMVWTVQ